MFCENCGSKLDDDSRFCLVCGTAVAPQALPPEDRGTEPVPPEAAAGLFSKKPAKIAAVIALVLAVVLLAAGAVLIFVLPTTVYVDNLIVIDYAGLSTLGTAEISMDADALTARLQEEMTAEEVSRMMERIAESSYTLELDKTSGLTNGDTLSIHFFMDNEIAREYGVQFKLKSSTVTVDALREPVYLDLFADLKLIYTGCSPYTTVAIENSSDNAYIQSGVTYSIRNDTDLEEGEKFTVEAAFSAEEANAAGYIILNPAKTYTATNLPQPELLDPFAHVEVLFSGLDGGGRVQHQIKDEDIPFMSFISFQFDKDALLTEGDVITLSYTVAEGQDPLQYGYTLAEGTAKQFTVPKLGTYLTDFQQLSAQGQAQLIQKATEIARLYLTRESADNKTGDMKLTGTGTSRKNQLSLAADLGNVRLHSVTACQDSPLTYHNKYLYFFFTVDITGHPSIKENGGNATGAMFLRISNPIVKSDGTLETDAEYKFTFGTNSYVYLSIDALNTALEGKLYNAISCQPASESA